MQAPGLVVVPEVEPLLPEDVVVELSEAGVVLLYNLTHAVRCGALRKNGAHELRPVEVGLRGRESHVTSQNDKAPLPWDDNAAACLGELGRVLHAVREVLQFAAAPFPGVLWDSGNLARVRVQQGDAYSFKIYHFSMLTMPSK